MAKKLPPFFSELNIHQSQIFQIVVVMIEDPTMTSLLQYLGADIPGIRAVKRLHALQTNGLKSDHAKLLGNFLSGKKLAYGTGFTETKQISQHYKICKKYISMKMKSYNLLDCTVTLCIEKNQ